MGVEAWGLDVGGEVLEERTVEVGFFQMAGDSVGFQVDEILDLQHVLLLLVTHQFFEFLIQCCVFHGVCHSSWLNIFYIMYCQNIVLP